MSSIVKITLGLLIIALAGCRISGEKNSAPMPISKRITWDGHSPTTYSFDSTGHHFEFAETDTIRLTLREFDREYAAFAAFEERANPSELGDGFFRERNILGFYHGRFLGEMQYARATLIPAHFLKSKLVFQGEELFLKPPEFQSFPLAGRVLKSERVVLKHFLGKNWPCPVFSVQYLCHTDTATAFRAFSFAGDSARTWVREWEAQSDTLSLGREIRFQGQTDLHEPIVFWVSEQGILGIVGCYDPVMALAYAQKMQKMTVLLPNP